jgi:TetR/AcrR family transcriptional repressor of uid operon
MMIMRKIDPEKHAERRQTIIDAAKGCFAQKGFHGTSTAEICAAAGMSPGNLFHYFPNKQAMIAAIVDQEGALTAAYFEAVGRETDLYAALVTFMDVVLDLAADPAFASLTLEIAAEAMREGEIRSRVERNDKAMREALQAVLREAARRGQIDATLDADGAAVWVAALIDGIFSRIAVDPDFRPLQNRKMMHTLLDRFLRHDIATGGS